MMAGQPAQRAKLHGAQPLALDQHPILNQVGQQVARTGNSPGPCEVEAQIAGRDGPEYRVRPLDGGSEAVVEERELTYSPASASTGPGSFR